MFRTECVNKGFSEIQSTSIIGCSIDSAKKTFTKLTASNQISENENSASIFGNENFVEEYLESVATQNKNLMLLKNYKTLIRKDHKTLVDTVKILSGGAATVDPLYSGSIGPGMITGAVFGGLKKSPPSLVILETIRLLSILNRQGILVIVPNNYGNRLNFGLACQSAALEGIKTLLVNVGDDVSGTSVSKTIGRKGLCGIKFLFKIAGAMAEEKKTLQEIYILVEKVKGNLLGTINIQICPDMMVIGPSHKGDSEKVCFLWRRSSNIGESQRVTFIANQALTYLFHSSSKFSLHVVKGDKIVIIMNKLGDLSDFFFSIITREILDQIKTLGIKVVRVYSGRFLNSRSTGFSLSVLKVKYNILKLLDYPVDVISWPKPSNITMELNVILDLPSSSSQNISSPTGKKRLGPKFTEQDKTYLLDALSNAIKTIKNLEEYLNKQDNDHDFGTAVTKFANAIQIEINNKTLSISSPFEFLEQMSYLAGLTMGGVAGGIFSILFSSAAKVFHEEPASSPVDIGMWMLAARAARDGIRKFTRVKPGDRTILDALDPFVESTRDNSVKGLSQRVTAAVKGAEGTSKKSSIRASLRTSINLFLEGVSAKAPLREIVREPDPGALCLACVFRTIFTTLQIELAESEVRAKAEMAALRKKLSISTKETQPKHDIVSKGNKSNLNIELKGEEPKGIPHFIEEEPKDTIKLKSKSQKEEEQEKHSNLGEEEELMHITSFENEPDHIRELKKEEPTSGSGLIEEEFKNPSRLNGNDHKNSKELKEVELKLIDSKLANNDEEDLNLDELLSHDSQKSPPLGDQQLSNEENELRSVH